MLKGLRTVIYGVSDIEKGKSWYTKAIGSPPYFDQPFYVGFDIGAKEHGEIRDVGEDIKVATVIDPFGNLLGIIYNPNFKAE